MRVVEPHLKERIEAAERKAKKLAHGQPDSEDELLIIYSVILSQKYNMPIFSEYFQERTIDELALEVFIWQEMNKKSTVGTDDFVLDDDVIKEATNEEAWEDLQSDADFIDQARKDFADKFNKE